MNLIRCALYLVVLGLASAEATTKPSTPPVIEYQGVRMTLRGEALLRVGYFFKVYWATLHVGENAPTDHVLADVPKRLELSYLRSIAAADLIAAGDAALRRQVPADQLSALQARLREINRHYRDVQAGDRYTLTYLPGRGSELAFNGTPLVVIPGADFAAAYFGIWLDPLMPYKEFRAALMGK